MALDKTEQMLLDRAIQEAKAWKAENCSTKKVDRMPNALAIRDALFNEEIQEYNGNQIDRRYDKNGRMTSRITVGNLSYSTQATDSGSFWAQLTYYTNVRIMWITQKHETKWKRWVGVLVNGELYQFDLKNYKHKWRIEYKHLLEPVTEAAPPAPAPTTPNHKYFSSMLKEFQDCTDEVIERMEDLIQRGVTRVNEEDVLFFLNWKKNNAELLEVAMALTVILQNVDTSVKYFEAKRRSAEAVEDSEFQDVAHGNEKF